MNFRFSFPLVVSLVLSFGTAGEIANAQDYARVNPDSIKTPIVKLLQQYEFYHNKLGKNRDQEVERSFIRLFSNPKIQVLSEMLTDTTVQRISVQDYMETILDYFPEGLSVRLYYSSISIGRPRLDRNDRFLVKVRINESKTGISNAKVHTLDRTVIFLIAFTWDGEAAGDFVIFGIDNPPVNTDVLGFTISPQFTRIYNGEIQTDKRFNRSGGLGYQSAISYSHFFNSHWGFTTGIEAALLKGKLMIDKFDDYGGFDPNLSTVVFLNQFWQAGIPLLVSYRYGLNSRLTFYAQAGVVPTVRIFETQLVSAKNNESGSRIDHVISDIDWIENLNRFNLGVRCDAGILYKISQRVGVEAGMNLYQGVTSLDHHIHLDYLNTKYLGQYNPLWGNGAATLSQVISFNLSILVTLNKETD